MIEFPPEFYGMVAAFWNTYQYTILIWFGIMFSCIVVIGLGYILSNIVKSVWSI
jgi:hypothetical protein